MSPGPPGRVAGSAACGAQTGTFERSEGEPQNAGAGSGATSASSNSASSNSASGGAAGDSGTASASAGGSSSSEAAIQCDYGRATRFCLSDSAMTRMARFGRGQSALDPPRSDQEVAAGFEASGCLRHDWVASSCCNPALGPGEPEGGQCCYQACEGACCGRALVIDGRARVSEPEPSSEWLLDGAPLSGSRAHQPVLSASERARLVELWQADALMEHCSCVRGRRSV